MRVARNPWRTPYPRKGRKRNHPPIESTASSNEKKVWLTFKRDVRQGLPRAKSRWFKVGAERAAGIGMCSRTKKVSEFNRKQ